MNWLEKNLGNIFYPVYNRRIEKIKPIKYLCKKFNYSLYVEKLINKIVEVILNDSDREIISIILLGSTSRGEITFVYYDQELELFSDLELWIVFNILPSKRNQQRIRNSLAKIESTVSYKNPFFHIDIDFFNLNRLSKMRPTIRSFETRETGFILYGKDVRTHIKQVTCTNINIPQTKELILTRLWNMLLYIPNNVVKKSENEWENKIFKYVICRNALDLLTIYLALNKILIPGYKKRFEYLCKHYKELPIIPVKTIELAMKGKLSFDFEFESRLFFSNVLDLYIQLLSWSTKMPFCEDINTLCKNIENTDLGFMTRRRIKWFLYELSIILNRKELFSSYRWPFRINKRELVTCFVISMLGCVTAKNNRDLIRYLDLSTYYFKKFSLKRVRVRIEDPVEYWLYLRNLFFEELFKFLHLPERKPIQ